MSFYFEQINGKKVLKSTLLKDVLHCFTTREINVEEVLSSFGAKYNIYPTQTHSHNVEFVDDRLEYPNTDSLILTKKDTTIYLKFADCTPIILYDIEQKIGAIVHAGWRGTAKSIGIKTIEKMNSKPENIIALIGPAIGECCYEVSDEVKQEVLSTVNNKEGLFNNRNIDLKQINARQLQEIGVDKIDICPYCTSCNNDLFYSYRKENGTDKRHYALFKL